MIFSFGPNSVTVRNENETLTVEAWGVNALRVRSTQNRALSGEDHALSGGEPESAEITENDGGVSIRNGKLTCTISRTGYLTFFKDGKPILKEYSRSWNGANRHSRCLNFHAREYKFLGGNEYAVKLRFEGQNGEKIFGMGQYQQPELDLKGCVLELCQRNSQASVPFYLSSLGYGFLWNNPCMGEVTFGKNYTEWSGKRTEEIDYWITADDTPKKLIENYTGVTGRAPHFPSDALGLWQSKLRYRTQEEVLSVAREYKRRNLPLDVIVIDFFHWVRQGDWDFDPEYWPDPAGMVKELREMGVRCMVSIWPTVDKESANFPEMEERGLLVGSEYGPAQGMAFAGDTLFADMLNPETRDFFWDRVRKTYRKYGIDLFWLDVAEPEYRDGDLEHYRHLTGSSAKVGNEYPKAYAGAVYDHMKADGEKDVVSLVRCAWAGTQKYGALVWSGDVESTFECLRDQVSAGLNMGIAGIPWWVSDTGGFHRGNGNDPAFRELLIRWFQFSTFCAVLRMHGDRAPHDIPALSGSDHGGGFLFTGSPNELWSFGDEVYGILKKYLDLRISMKDYLRSVFDEASQNGAPVIRAMFLEFPEDKTCWEVDDQYMFGPSYLVAPVLYLGERERKVYLPAGKWKDIHTGKVLDGGREILAPAPLDVIPVYQKMEETK